MTGFLYTKKLADECVCFSHSGGALDTRIHRQGECNQKSALRELLRFLVFKAKIETALRASAYGSLNNQTRCVSLLLLLLPATFFGRNTIFFKKYSTLIQRRTHKERKKEKILEKKQEDYIRLLHEARQGEGVSSH